MVSLPLKKGVIDMSVMVRYMLRPAAHCKEGCSQMSWVRRKTAHPFLAS